MARKISTGFLDIMNAVPIGVILSLEVSESELSDFFNTTTGESLSEDFKGWALMSGSSSPYNASGRYLRGVDTDDGEEAGDLLGYRTSLPLSSLSFADDAHSHIYYDRYLSEIDRSSSDISDNDADYTTGTANIEGGADDNMTFYWTERTDVATGISLDSDDETSEHTHTLSGGDSETRPNSIVVAFIIKTE